MKLYVVGFDVSSHEYWPGPVLNLNLDDCKWYNPNELGLSAKAFLQKEKALKYKEEIAELFIGTYSKDNWYIYELELNE